MGRRRFRVQAPGEDDGVFGDHPAEGGAVGNVIPGGCGGGLWKDLRRGGRGSG